MPEIIVYPLAILYAIFRPPMSAWLPQLIVAIIITIIVGIGSNGYRNIKHSLFWPILSVLLILAVPFPSFFVMVIVFWFILLICVMRA